jgi:hypothetical protein
MPSSTQSVLGMPELFENILLYLHRRTLLTAAQLVSRHWHTTIVHSPALQRALFFQPWPAIPSSSPSTAAGKEQQPYPQPEVNPLLAAAFAMFFDGRPFQRDAFELLPFAHGSEASCHDAFMRVGASWRRMLTCQPPVMRLGTWYCQGGQRSQPLPGPDNPGIFWDQTFPSEEEKEEPVAWPELGLPGLRMGTLYDRVTDSLCKQAGCSIALYWDIERHFTPRGEREDEEEGEGLRPDETLWPSAEEYVNVHNGKENWDDWETVQLLLLSKAARTVDAVIMLYVKGSCLMGWRPPPDKRFEKQYKFPAAKAETRSSPR